MTKAQRVFAAVALATGASALAAPSASAAGSPVPHLGTVSVAQELDHLAVTSIPAEHRSKVPLPSGQLNELASGLDRLNELRQVTDQAAPVLGLLGALE
ncbi:hypothetical protein [Streptomyces sp. PR69]|uniref:hypothetical protein n=1 Tax=Streptomyces sp. PR69 TaxID=2984950 RepID=UPI0022646734|nr:hypothetical protein [Streptomyces sp. PR69]